MTERSSRESGGTGNAGAGAGRGGKDVGGQRDRDGRNRDFRGNPDKGKWGGASDKVGRTYGTSPNRTNSLGVTTSRTPGAMVNAESIAHEFNNPSVIDKLLSMAGITDVNPLEDPNLNLAEDSSPSKQLDILGAALGIGGAFAGVPSGAIYGIGKRVWNNYNPEDQFNGVNVPIGNYSPMQSDYGKLPDGSLGGPPQTRATPNVTNGITPGPAAQSRAPTNNRIGGYSGGGYNMGAFGKKPSKKSGYLAQQLMAP